MPLQPRICCAARPSLHTPRYARAPRSTFQRSAVPASVICCRVVSALEEREQRRIRITCDTHCVVGQQELVELLAEEAFLRLDDGRAETLWLRIGVGVERGVDSAAARPESGAADLVRIRLLSDLVRQRRNAARMERRRPSGEAGGRKIEAAPEEVHRAALADEARPELLQHPVGRSEEHTSELQSREN